MLLIVDDQPVNADLLTIMLRNRGYETITAYSGEDALKAVATTPVDLILLDVSMPIMDGYEVCRILKADERFRDIPVIFVSAISDVRVKVEGFQVGGIDYITKPFQREELLVRVRTHLEMRSRQLEIERLQRQEIVRLQEVNQLKDDLLQMVSHDLKSPLSAIKGGIAVLEMTLGSTIQTNERANSSLDIIRRSTNRMLQLVLNVLDAARLEGQLVARYESINLIPFLRQHLEDVKYAAQAKHIEMKFSPPPGDCQVALAPHLFTQVIDNLLANALKYTSAGGSVELSAEVTETEVAITVSDTGKGIPEDAIPHLFDKFFRVDPDVTGTGLGLSIVKSIVDLHEGHVFVESRVGQGSRFTVTIPHSLVLFARTELR
jgi:signal transduction histidine kinase